MFNLGNPKTVTLNKFVKLIETSLSKKSKKKFIKKQMGDVLKTKSNNILENKLFNFKYKTNLNEGIKKFTNWFLNEYEKNIKFGILGLGRVIENRVYKVFKNELKLFEVLRDQCFILSEQCLPVENKVIAFEIEKIIVHNVALFIKELFDDECHIAVR